MPTAVGPFLLQHLLALFGHHVEGFVPGHRLELAVLGVDAVSSCATAASSAGPRHT